MTFMSFNVEIDPTGPVDEVALLHHKLVATFLRLNGQSIVMNEISSKCAARTAGRRIFRDVVGRREEPGVCARGANFDRLTSECVTTCCPATSIDLRQQRSIYLAVAKVS